MQDDPTRTAEEGYFAWEREDNEDEGYQEWLCDERRQARVDDEHDR